MKRKIVLMLTLFMTFSMTFAYATEDNNEPVYDADGNEITDPEILDRIRILEERKKAEEERLAEEKLELELRHSGLSEASTEIQGMIAKSLMSHNIPIDVRINDMYLKTDVDALGINGRTYVPLRAITEAFNLGEITWSEEQYKATIVVGEENIQFLVNTNNVAVNGELIELDSPIVVVEGRTMVPIRFISEWLGFNVEWDSTYFTATLTSSDYSVNPERLEHRIYSYEELQTFSKLVMKEAGSVSYECKHGVASVVMNQVYSAELEDTINGVIFDVSRLPHFPPAHKDEFSETVPNSECVLAVKKVLRGENSVGTCIFFNTTPFKGRTIYKVVDGVYFCY